MTKQPEEIELLKNEVENKRNTLSTDRLDMSIGEIISMYERKEIIIDPDFQRLFRWDDYQKTRLIESILIGIPIPPIFVAENERGEWELVDGLQRTSTIFSFFGILRDSEGILNPEKNNWTLTEGDLIKNLRGFTAKDLPLNFQLNIKRASCRVEIIRQNSSFNMRYELFNRLNTGGSQLTDQEIRNCIFRGSGNYLNRILKECANENKFLEIIGPTDKQLDELYVEELVLRLFTLIDSEISVSKNLSEQMTDYMKDTVSKSDEYINDLKLKFIQIIGLLYQLGTGIFRGRNNVFSSNLFDGIVYGVGKNLNLYSESNISTLNSKITSLRDDHEFIQLSRTVASNNRMFRKSQIASRIFSSI